MFLQSLSFRILLYPNPLETESKFNTRMTYDLESFTASKGRPVLLLNVLQCPQNGQTYSNNS